MGYQDRILFANNIVNYNDRNRYEQHCHYKLQQWKNRRLWYFKWYQWARYIGLVGVHLCKCESWRNNYWTLCIWFQYTKERFLWWKNIWILFVFHLNMISSCIHNMNIFLCSHVYESKGKVRKLRTVKKKLNYGLKWMNNYICVFC